MRLTAAVGDHPNLVRVIGVCEDGDKKFIVLDRADGRHVRGAVCGDLTSAARGRAALRT